MHHHPHRSLDLLIQRRHDRRWRTIAALPINARRRKIQLCAARWEKKTTLVAIHSRCLRNVSDGDGTVRLNTNRAVKRSTQTRKRDLYALVCVIHPVFLSISRDTDSFNGDYVGILVCLIVSLADPIDMVIRRSPSTGSTLRRIDKSVVCCPRRLPRLGTYVRQGVSIDDTNHNFLSAEMHRESCQAFSIFLRTFSFHWSAFCARA